MPVHATCKFEKIGSKLNEGVDMETLFSPLQVLEGWSDFQQTYYGISKISWPILIKFICIISGMGGSLLLGFGTDSIKTVVAMATESPYWCITPKWLIRSGLNSNLSEILCLSWLLAILTKIWSKANELAWRHHFPIIRQEIFKMLSGT